MCGIMGYYCFGKARPSKKNIEEAFAELSERGRDASGFAFLDSDNVLKVHKKNVDSVALMKGKPWEELDCEAPIMIFHTRAATKGRPENNKNNHPIFTKKGICLVHNGMVDDYEKDFEENRDGEVDSEILVYYLNKYKTLEEGIKELTAKVSGSYAIAVINKAEPTKLLLCRNSNPIIVCIDHKEKILFFASTKEIVYKMATERTELGVTYKPLVLCEFPDENWNIIDTKGMGKNHKFSGKSVRNFYYRQPAYGSYGHNSFFGHDYERRYSKVEDLMTVDEYYLYINGLSKKELPEKTERTKNVFVCDTITEQKTKECKCCEYINEDILWCKKYCMVKTQNK